MDTFNPQNPSRSAGGAARPFRRWPGLLLVLLLGSLMLEASLSGADAPVAKEHQIKAAFIFNFLKFAEWPAEKFADASSPIVIGVTGMSPVCATLETTVKDRKINGRDIVVRVINANSPTPGIHLLCLAGTEDVSLPEALAAVKGKSVLTVGDGEKFARAGGMIIFVPEADKLRFEINVEAAEQEGLKISAQLQKLAKSIRKQK